MKLLAFILPLLFFVACKKQNPVVDTPIIISEEPLIILSSDWEKDNILSLDFPKSAAVYQNKSALNGHSFKATAFVFNLADTNLVISTALNTNRLTPNNWLANEKGNILAVINGGYFDLTNGQSYSLVVNENKMLSANVKALTRSFNGVNTSYYPTRCAFGLTDRKPSCEWIYNVTGTVNYAYPGPSPNALNAAPEAKPSETFPVNGSVWSPQTAIGGSPMLLKNGNVMISDVEELIDVNNKTGRSRSAIGFTAKNRVVILAIEKNATTENLGASLAEMAQLLKDIGCTNAINLDGGGSTCLLVNNGKTTNQPEGNTQRAVSSVIFVKKKN